MFILPMQCQVQFKLPIKKDIHTQYTYILIHLCMSLQEGRKLVRIKLLFYGSIEVRVVPRKYYKACNIISLIMKIDIR